jgi:hypothetical protein
LERAKKAARAAIQAERSGELGEAFDYYLLAAEIINKIIAYEKVDTLRDKYYVKSKEYVERAKELKLLMSKVSDEPEPKTDALSKDSFPSPPSSKDQKPKTSHRPSSPDKKSMPLPPPPPDKDEKPSSKFPSDRTPPPSPPPPKKDETKSRTTSKQAPQPKPSPPKPKSDTKKKEKKTVELPTKTTFEQLFDQGKYRLTIVECAQSIEAELRVRMGLFDEKQTLGMLLEKGIKKGMTALKEFKYVNILMNRIEHENYRPSREEAKKAVEITNKILLS